MNTRANMPPPVETQVQQDLTADIAQLASDLAAALAVERDAALQSWLRAQCGVGCLEPIYVRLGSAEVWARIAQGDLALERQAAAPGGRFDLFGELRRDATLWPRLRASVLATGSEARAQALLGPIFERGRDPSRSSMAALHRWAPLLERAAYRFGARCIAALSEIRQGLAAPTNPGGHARSQALQTYWRLLLANSHLSLVAANKGARPWLVDMTGTFQWIEWTPSLSLVQERSLWFGAVAARSAAAFGDAVIEKYLRALALATQPMKVFDAAFALSAIALDDPGVIPDLRPTLAAQAQAFMRQDGRYGALQASMVESALACLADPEGADRAFLKATGVLAPTLEQGRGLLGRTAVRLDLTTPIASEGYLGLLGLPRLLRTPLLELYPATTRQPAASNLPASDIAAHLARAFKDAPKPPVKLH